MKRYYFNIRNAEGTIIQKLNVVANSLDFAKEKIAFKLKLAYKGYSSFLQSTFDYHEAAK